MRAEYDRRRKFAVGMLGDMGLNCLEPKGAFYVFPEVRARTGMDGEHFAEELLRAQKVAVVPGTAFGASGKTHVRCTYASSLKTLNIAFERIREYLNGLG